MKMKRVLCLMLAVLMMVPAVACGKGKKEKKEKKEKAFKAAAGKVQIFQLAPESGSLMMNYLIKTPNNKIVIIDGGIDGTGADKSPYMPSAIRAVLGLGQEDYFEVEAWFLSHQHSDHINELAKMLKGYSIYSNYSVNNIYFDFPEIGEEWDSKAGESDYDTNFVKSLRAGINHYYVEHDMKPPEEITENRTRYWYDQINGAVINKESVENGLSIEIDGLRFDILQTWSKKDNYVNSTSVIIRLVYGEHSVLFLGDSATDSSSRLLKKYGADALKSEYVQMGHHGQAGPDRKFYDAIDTANSIRLWPTPKWVWEVENHETLHTDETRSWVGLPTDYTQFNKSDRDYVAGEYDYYPTDPTAVSSWTEKVLKNQLVATW